MDNFNSKSFCILPWIHSFVNSNGAYQVCCTSEEYHEGIPDIDGANYNIKNRPNLNEIMNSDFMKNLRMQMLQGDWNKVCTRCYETEKLDGVSRRVLENLNHDSLISNLVENTHSDGSIELGFKSLDYRLGNLCNLQCRMCGPHSSDKWINDWNEVAAETNQLSNEQISYYQNFKWINQDYLIDELKEKIQGVERIHFAGGEPLLSPQMTNILKKCIELGVSGNISVSYNTNITVLPKEILNLWKEFKEIKILCSVDGFNQVNEYIRFPSKWKIIDANLEYLDNHAKELNISEILLSCTVQIYNVLSLGELYNYLNKFKTIVPALNLINLHFPDYLSTKALPLDAKIEATKRLKQIANDLEDKLQEKHHYLVENIYQSINFMNESDLSLRLIMFKKFNSKFDEKKNTKLSQVLPELNNFLLNFYFEKINHILSLSEKEI